MRILEENEEFFDNHICIAYVYNNYESEVDSLILLHDGVERLEPIKCRTQWALELKKMFAADIQKKKYHIGSF